MIGGIQGRLPYGSRDATLQARSSKQRRSVFAMLAPAGLLAIAIAAAAAIGIVGLHDGVIQTTNTELNRISLILAHEADRTFQSVDLVENSILERLGALDSEAGYRTAVSGIATFQDLQARMNGLPQIEAITAIDEAGKLLNFSRYWPIPNVNVSDRDYFIALRDTPALTTYFSEPVRNRGTGSWTVYVARKVRSTQGQFLGMVLVSLRLSYFESLYESTALGPGSSIDLFREDGKLLARFPHNEGEIGEPLAAEEMRMLHAIRRDGAASPAIGKSAGQTDFSALYLLAGHPLGVGVTITADRVLANWRSQAASIAAVALLLEVALAVISALVLHRIRSQTALSNADIARHHAEAELALSREREVSEEIRRLQDNRYGMALETMIQGVNMFDANERLILANTRYAEMFGIAQDQLSVGMLFDEVVALAVGGALSTETVAAEAKKLIKGYIESGEPASYVRDLEDGRSLAACVVPMEGGGWLATYEDITERRKAQAQITYMAQHDALTGLSNRVLFNQRLEEALARSRRGEGCAILCLDLDHFKAVNDTMGHPTGDALLRAVTTRLTENCREIDTVSRLGGDEFAIIQSNPENPEDTIALAERLIATISEPFEIDGNLISIGTSIGIAMVPDDGDDAVTLLRNADLALYKAKADGRGSYSFFEADLDARMQARRTLEIEIRLALKNDEFTLFYQPIMDLKSRTLEGFEALIRWNHPTRGMVSPDVFIPLAEEIGLITPIGEWVLHQACMDAAGWPGDFKVAINLSSVQFSGKGPVPSVLSALAASGLPASRLELEVTETVMLEDTASTLGILQALKALGVSIAMDDFGTGYSSLNYLRKFPFDRVKIDKSFVADNSGCSENLAIVDAVTTLCKTLGMATTIEGIETEAQMNALFEGDGTNVQGYLFGRPQPAVAIAALCTASLCGPSLQLAS